jgi:hypothetical protein
MKQPDPIRTAARRAKRERAIGPDAACCICGQAQPEALKHIRRSLLERHHVVGNANDNSLTAVVCLTHHAILTERLERRGVSMGEPRDLLQMLVMIFRALADFFHLLADALLRWADDVTRLIEAQDAAFPTWRELPEAHA